MSPWGPDRGEAGPSADHARGSGRDAMAHLDGSGRCDQAVADLPEFADTAGINLALPTLEAGWRVSPLCGRVHLLLGCKAAGDFSAAHPDAATSGPQVEKVRCVRAEPVAVSEAKSRAPAALPSAAVPEGHRADRRYVYRGGVSHRGWDHLLVPDALGLDASTRVHSSLRVRFEERNRHRAPLLRSRRTTHGRCRTFRLVNHGGNHRDGLPERRCVRESERPE